MNTQLIMTLNLKDGSILLSKGVLNALDWPRQVQMMVNPSEKKLMLRACTVEDRDAVVVPDGQTEPFEISARLFMKKIREMVGWEDTLPRACCGEYLPAHQAVIFNLEDAQPLELVQG